MFASSLPPWNPPRSLGLLRDTHHCNTSSQGRPALPLRRKKVERRSETTLASFATESLLDVNGVGKQWNPAEVTSHTDMNVPRGSYQVLMTIITEPRHSSPRRRPTSSQRETSSPIPMAGSVVRQPEPSCVCVDERGDDVPPFPQSFRKLAVNLFPVHRFHFFLTGFATVKHDSSPQRFIKHDVDSRENLCVDVVSAKWHNVPRNW